MTYTDDTTKVLKEAEPETEKVELRLVIEAAVRRAVEPGFKWEAGSIDALNEKVLALVREASLRCHRNGRVTIRPCDF